ncbi:MAG: hypothetical protein UY40_C0006G0016 [candidate division CPR1 bacterium GW2011_GWC1_49_13]|uniref:Uncharacterized protein n=1 Tax=candidate division CPR1 bacterium GW2011_GWC1_49_13 TaxID=1618342 RepID=A0A0G1XTL7_9BACT|nr:MAG: hypothetical protein UY40_C0006G0016 [candidate division CPR1 bacterium GW2011_GWC1_49_13]
MYIKAFGILVLAVFAITGFGYLTAGLISWMDFLPPSPGPIEYFWSGLAILSLSSMAAIAFIIMLGLIAEILPNPKVKKR